MTIKLAKTMFLFNNNVQEHVYVKKNHFVFTMWWRKDDVRTKLTHLIIFLYR